MTRNPRQNKLSENSTTSTLVFGFNKNFISQMEIRTGIGTDEMIRMLGKYFVHYYNSVQFDNFFPFFIHFSCTSFYDSISKRIHRRLL